MTYILSIKCSVLIWQIFCFDGSVGLSPGHKTVLAHQDRGIENLIGVVKILSIFR